MNTGQTISLVGHAGLIGVLLFGGAWNSDPLPFEVTDVSVVSEAEYQAALSAFEAPQAATEVQTPAQPDENEGVQPETAEPEVQPQVQDAPEVASPEAETVPQVDTSEPEAPVEQAEDTAPTLVQPEEDFAVLVPGASVRPKLRPSERIAPEPVDQPTETPAEPDETPAEETAPDETAEIQQDQTDASAPEEATSEIDPEASDDVTLAPAQSARPRGRPQRQAQAETAPVIDTSRALEEAIGGGNDETAQEQTTPSGPPLTGGEREGLKLAISRCYNLGALSSEALAVNIYVRMNMTRDGKPVVNSIELLRSENGSADAARKAYEAARRAIIICGSNGFDLPVEKYEQWKTIEIKFNPESLR